MQLQVFICARMDAQLLNVGNKTHPPLQTPKDLETRYYHFLSQRSWTEPHVDHDISKWGSVVPYNRVGTLWCNKHETSFLHAEC